MPAGSSTADPVREKAFQDYRKKLMEHKEVESRLKDSKYYNGPILPNHLHSFDTNQCSFS